MNQFIQDVLTSKDFITSLIVAVAFFIAGKSWNMLWRFFQSLRQSFREFSVAGFWVGTCALPSYAGRHCLEIWRFTHKRERIQFHFFAYPPPGCGHNNRSAGMGVFSGGVMSAVYYSLDPSSNESGVLALRLRGRCLTGVYAQFDLDTPEETFFASDDTYSLHRVRLPFTKVLMYAFGISPFNDYAEIARFCADTPLTKRLEPLTTKHHNGNRMSDLPTEDETGGNSSGDNCPDDCGGILEPRQKEVVEGGEVVGYIDYMQCSRCSWNSTR